MILDEIEYIGKIKHGKKHGKGKVKYSNISSFEGNWKNGEKNGDGEYSLTLDQFFILGGDNEKDISYQSNDFYSLQYINDKFIKNDLCKMLEGKCLFGIEFFLHYIYIFGGFNGNKSIDDIDRYNFFTNEWENVASLSERRSGCFTVTDTDNYKIYIIGGTQKGDILTLIEEYDILTNSCSNFINSKSKRTCGGAIYYENKIYMYGGLKYTKDNLYLEILDLKTKEIEMKENIMLNIMGAASCFAIMEDKPCIFIACGENEDKEYTNEFFYYDIENEKICDLPQPLHKRKYSSLVKYKENLYLIGGFDGKKIVSNIEIFSLTEKIWKVEKNKIIKKCGSGIIAVENKNFVLKGKWKNNHLQGKGIIYENNCCVSTGNYKKNIKESFFFEMNNEILYDNGIIISEDELKIRQTLKKKKIPEHFKCPISHELMRNPVVTSCGTTYEKENIKKWLKENKIDPLTRQTINDTLISNLILKTLIQDFIEN